MSLPPIRHVHPETEATIQAARSAGAVGLLFLSQAPRCEPCRRRGVLRIVDPARAAGLPFDAPAICPECGVVAELARASRAEVLGS